MDKVAAGRYDFNGDEWVWISEDAKKIIKKLLEYDPDSRINAENALADPWIKNLLLRKKSTSLLARTQLRNLKTFRVFLL